MAFSYRELFCGGRTFCCCLPVRIGVVIMSLLGIVFGGVLSIILWFEVASTTDMTSGERAGFVVAGLVETLLFTASILGFVGAIVRKQLFVQIYAYFIYVHFLLNIGIAGYLLYIVTHFSATATVKACQETVQNQQAKDQCNGLLKIAQGVYFVIATIVLLVELYAALIVTRYVNQIKTEKYMARTLRRDNEEAFALVPKGKDTRYSSIPSGQDVLENPYIFPSHSDREFDPYYQYSESVNSVRRSSTRESIPGLPVEVGYGGGSWTYSEISEEEKARLKGRDSQIAQEHKPPMVPLQESRTFDDLPRYTLSDPPALGP